MSMTSAALAQVRSVQTIRSSATSTSTSVEDRGVCAVPNLEHLKEICKKQIMPLQYSRKSYNGTFGIKFDNENYSGIEQIIKTIVLKYKELTEENIAKMVLFIEKLEIKDFNARAFILALKQFAQADSKWFSSEKYSKEMQEILKAIGCFNLETFKKIEPLDFSQLNTPTAEFEICLNALGFKKLIFILEKSGHEVVGQALIQRAIEQAIRLDNEFNMYKFKGADFLNQIGILYPREYLDSSLFAKLLENTIIVLNHELYYNADAHNFARNYFMKIIELCPYFVSSVNADSVQALFIKSIDLFSNSSIHSTFFKGHAFHVFLIEKFGVIKIGRDYIQLYFDRCLTIRENPITNWLSSNLVDFYAAIDLLKFFNEQGRLDLLDILKLEGFYNILKSDESVQYHINQIPFLPVYLKAHRAELEAAKKAQGLPVDESKCALM